MKNVRGMLILAGAFAFGCGGQPEPNLEVVEKPSPSVPPAPAPESAPSAKTLPAAPPPTVPRLSLDDQRALLDGGRQAVLDGDLTTAEQKLKEVILQSIDGGDSSEGVVAEARYNLGVLAEWQGLYDDAKRHYEAALSRRPELGAAVVAIGRIMLRGGDEASALNYARGRLIGRAKSIPLRNALNRLRVAASRELGRVEADSKAVLRADEKNVDAMINLATTYHRAGKYELAVAILKNAKALEPKNPEIMWRISQGHVALEDKIRARMILEEATQLPQGATAEVYNNLGLIYHEAGDFAGAEIQFRKALARWPDMLQAQVNLGNALKGQQRYPEAKEAFEKARARVPGEPVLTYNLGILLLDGQFPTMQPLERLERALSLFNEYKAQSMKMNDQDPVNAYVVEAEKRIVVEKKRAEQMRRRPKAPVPAPAETPGPDGGGASTSPEGGGQ